MTRAVAVHGDAMFDQEIGQGVSCAVHQQRTAFAKSVLCKIRKRSFDILSATAGLILCTRICPSSLLIKRTSPDLFSSVRCVLARTDPVSNSEISFHVSRSSQTGFEYYGSRRCAE